jgi:hypothetical protein
MTRRFDPRPDASYANCIDCEATLATREELDQHLADTMQDRGSHVVQITNPSRQERIERELINLVEEALDDWVSNVEDLQGDVTQEELTTAMRKVTPEFADAWARSTDSTGA